MPVSKEELVENVNWLAQQFKRVLPKDCLYLTGLGDQTDGHFEIRTNMNKRQLERVLEGMLKKVRTGSLIITPYQ
jgi:hypothetical protein